MKERSIYEFPDIFRAVHMEQPGEIAAEVDFLKRVWARHLKRRVRRVLDVASGNSPHGQLLAREGIAVTGIDRSPTMIAAGRIEAGQTPVLAGEVERIGRRTDRQVTRDRDLLVPGVEAAGLHANRDVEIKSDLQAEPGCLIAAGA